MQTEKQANKQVRFAYRLLASLKGNFPNIMLTNNAKTLTQWRNLNFLKGHFDKFWGLSGKF